MDLKKILDSIKVLLSGEELVNEEVALATEVTDEATEDIVVEFETQTLEDGQTVIEAETFAEGSAVFIVTETDNVPLPIGEYMLADGRSLVVQEEGVIFSIGEVASEEQAPEDEELAETSVSLEEHNTAIAALQAQIDELKASLNLSAETITEKDTVIEDLNLKLSKLPAVNKLTHSPETLAFREAIFSKEEKLTETTFSKILDGISNKTNK